MGGASRNGSRTDFGSARRHLSQPRPSPATNAGGMVTMMGDCVMAVEGDPCFELTHLRKAR